jgi:hypothetical protein
MKLNHHLLQIRNGRTLKLIIRMTLIESKGGGTISVALNPCLITILSDKMVGGKDY